MSARLLLIILFTLGLTACTVKDTAEAHSNRDTMTVRQKDSVLGQSVLPGAHVVTKAMVATDSLSARNGRATTDNDTLPTPREP
jgi:hypothetical protein